jgi:hypothetical protein
MIRTGQIVPLPDTVTRPILPGWGFLIVAPGLMRMMPNDPPDRLLAMQETSPDVNSAGTRVGWFEF